MRLNFALSPVNALDATPFSIGIYGSPDGVRPVELLQTCQVTDPALLSMTAGSQTHTVSFAPDLGGGLSQLSASENGTVPFSHYLLAKLDVYDEVYETTKTDNVSAPLAETAFQDSNGDLYVLPSAARSTATQYNGLATYNGTPGTDYLDATSLSGVLGESFSVEFWFDNTRPDNSNLIDGYIYSRDGTGFAIGIDGTMGGLNPNCLFLFIGGSQCVASTFHPAVNTWYHLVATYDQIDSSDVEVCLYVDGDQKIDSTISVSQTLSGTSNYFGVRGDGAFAFQGSLAEAAIYNSVLGQAAVTAHYGDASSTSTTAYVDAVMASSPVAYYQMQETSGTTAYDSSPGGDHDGTYGGWDNSGPGPTLNQPGPALFTGSGGQAVTVTQDAATGEISVGGESYAGVGTVYISLSGGGNVVTIDSDVTAPVMIYGGDGGDTITDDGSGGDTIYGGTATNIITLSGSGDNTVYAGPGNDHITDNGTGDNTIYGGAGNDTITDSGSGNDEIYSGAGSDTITDSSSGNDWIQLGGGGGTINASGSSGDDWLYAGAGNATITGGSGHDVIHGGSGTDTLTGGSGLDEIYGGSGTNYIYGNGTHDVLQGGSGPNAWNYIDPEGGGLASIEVHDYSNQPTFDGTDPAASEAVDPNQNITYASGTVFWDYQNSDLGLGNGTGSVQVSVYVTWDENATLQAGDHRGNAQYTIMNGTTLLDTSGSISQAAVPTDHVDASGRPWKLLGTYTVSGQPIASAACLSIIVADADGGDLTSEVEADAVMLQVGATFQTPNNDAQSTSPMGRIFAQSNGAAYAGDDYMIGNAPQGMGPHWTFSDFDSGVRLGEDTSTEVAVYATWDSNPADTPLPTGTQWAADTEYVVFDVYNNIPTFLGAYPVDQAPPTGSTRAWTPLGVWDMQEGHTLSVELWDYSIQTGDRVCAGDVKIHALWPTVSIRPTDVTVNPDVAPANDGEYTDWLDSWQGVDVPVEGQGDRAQLQLSAAIDGLYENATDWLAELGLPRGANGLEFWDSPTGGSPLTPAQFNQSISSGDYAGTVWVSFAASSAVTATTSLAPLSALVTLACAPPPTPGTGTGEEVAASANTEKHVIQVVVSGFKPFGPNSSGTGPRTENTSEVVANEVVKNNTNPDIHITEVIMPVYWREPLEEINKALKSAKNNNSPIDLWMAFGENARCNPADEFRVETVAQNRRLKLEDSEHKTPGGPGCPAENVRGGLATLWLDKALGSLTVANLVAGLRSGTGVNVVKSEDAGQYVCEDMLYSLLYKKSQSPDLLKNVLFIHTPAYNGSAKNPIVQKFSSKILDAALAAFGLGKA